MREIFFITVWDGYDVRPMGAAHPLWTNTPKNPERHGMMPAGARDSGFRSSQGFGTGFPSGMSRPDIRFRHQSRVQVDIYSAARGTFMISDKAKVLFERIDPDAFEFVEADTRLPDGTPGPKYWVLDVVRTINAVDERRWGVEILASGIAAHDPRGGNILRKDRIAGAHVFRLPGGYTLACDAEFKTSCEEAGLVNISFDPMGYAQ